MGFDWQPVKVDESGGDVPGPDGGEESGAAEFCTYWSLSRALLGTPDRTPLQ